MTRLSRKLEELLSDITFAEDRDFTSSIEETLRTMSQKIEDTFTAIAFAEAGEFEAALSYIQDGGGFPKSPRPGAVTGKGTILCTGRA